MIALYSAVSEIFHALQKKKEKSGTKDPMITLCLLENGTVQAAYF